jgi:ketosteroid isomerase-like protein
MVVHPEASARSDLGSRVAESRGCFVVARYLATKMEPGNVELVCEIIDALNRSNVDGMVARMDRQFEWLPLEESPVARIYRGHEQVRRYMEDWLSTFDVLRLDLEEPSEVGDHVVVTVRGHGRGRASGVYLNNRFCQVWTLRRGRAVRMQEYATREQALAALH